MVIRKSSNSPAPEIRVNVTDFREKERGKARRKASSKYELLFGYQK